MAGWLASTQDCNCKSSGQGLTPERDRVKDWFSVLQSRCICRVISACLAFMRPVRDYLWPMLKIQRSPFDKRRLTNNQWHKSTRMIQSHFQTCKLEPYIFYTGSLKWAELIVVCRHILGSDYMPASFSLLSQLSALVWAVSKLTDTGENTKATLKWCCIMAWVVSQRCGRQ